MARRTNNFNIWNNGIPEIAVGGDPLFGLWSNGVPVIDIDEAVLIFPRFVVRIRPIVSPYIVKITPPPSQFNVKVYPES